MVAVYVELIRKGLKKIKDVPGKIRDQVKKYV